MLPATLQTIIEQYIQAYNQFDVPGMLTHLHPDIEFRNISNGEVTHSLKGKAAFREQAEQAVRYFSQRKQSIQHINFQPDQAEVLLDYVAVLAIDLPNGMKKGDTLQLKGKSVFRFQYQQIILIEDIS
ncbi:nuclear transport factor 2 family protein [Rhodocytophaga rosea]|uniref:Nuclear transport factor 2 family protein n=1 Tax=Rhodocytophaga rosea TaxID=2704465 RepID=A0A6C0GDI6_9BACT|nr:nuclear transport factor 2 family protein [Rhodocytophaga rosea]QHT65863.1 nuclear transport factor 2 family protein [Rhodocytophaga rosea]